jgi:TATA-box binding protein (TBP) (component of TFIID and TFIIIB)
MATNTLMNPHLTFPEFNDIKVSTKTFIAMTNLSLDLQQLFLFLPITDYIVIPKRRGRKKKVEKPNPNIDICSGSIITLKFEDKLRGVDLRKKKLNTSASKRGKWFRNSFTVVIVMDDKTINFKICQNGMFQITGCKTDDHAKNCVKYIWDYIKDETELYSFSRGEELECLFIPAMRNIDFGLGFLVDREKLARYMSVQTEFHSLLETSFGYTGVNIKIPVTNLITTMKIKKLKYSGKWEEETVYYTEYLNLLSPKDREKKINKERYNTFLVFHSGKVIMSGCQASFMRDTYYYFLNIIRTCYDQIEERLGVISD